MKTEKEVREYRDSLLWHLAHATCKCADCRRANEDMHATACILTWVIGEGDEAQGSIDAFNESVAKERASA